LQGPKKRKVLARVHNTKAISRTSSFPRKKSTERKEIVVNFSLVVRKQSCTSLRVNMRSFFVGQTWMRIAVCWVLIVNAWKLVIFEVLSDSGGLK
jgi:hypothetical protein